MMITVPEILFFPFSMYFVDVALNGLNYNEKDSMIDKYQISYNNCSSSLYICEVADCCIGGVEWVTCDVDDEVIQREPLYAF